MPFRSPGKARWNELISTYVPNEGKDKVMILDHLGRNWALRVGDGPLFLQHVERLFQALKELSLHVWICKPLHCSNVSVPSDDGQVELSDWVLIGGFITWNVPFITQNVPSIASNVLFIT